MDSSKAQNHTDKQLHTLSELASDLPFEEKVDNLYNILANELNIMAHHIDSITSQMKVSNNVTLNIESQYAGLFSMMYRMDSSPPSTPIAHPSDQNILADSTIESSTTNEHSIHISTHLFSAAENPNQTSPSKS